MRRQGEDFHRLVEHLERALVSQPGVTIESPKYVPDKITGGRREHDIVLTYQSPHRQVVVAIECRDRGRRVTVGQVEEFHTKCRDTGVDKGIIVASGGVAGTARKKAAHHGIDCLTLAQVSQVDWCGMEKIVIRQRKPKHAHMSLGLPASLKGKAWNLFVRNPDGDVEAIDTADFGNLVARVWHQVPDPGKELSGIAHVEITNVHDFFVTDDDGTEHPIKHLRMDITFEATESNSPLSFYRYEAEKNRAVHELMVTGPGSFGELRGRVMLVRDDEARFRLLFLQADSPQE